MYGLNGIYPGVPRRGGMKGFYSLYVALCVGAGGISAALPEIKQTLPGQSSSSQTVAEAVIMDRLQGIVLAQSQTGDALRQRGISVVGLTIPEEEKLKSELARALDKPLNQMGLIEIRHQILRHFHAHGCHLVMVTVPEQNISDGILELTVTHSVLGKIHVKGTNWSNPKQIAGLVKLVPGEHIDENALFQQVSFVNRSPFRRAEVIYAPGQEPLTTDIELIVREKRPFRVYIGSENTGLKPIGRWRNFVGFNWGNAFGRGDIFSYQFASSPDFKKFRAHTFNYTSLFANHQVLQFFGGYSHVRSDPMDGIARSTGYSLQLSGRCDVPLTHRGRFRHEVAFGADFKRMNSNLEFTISEIADEHHFVNVTQVLAGYTWGIDYSALQMEGSLEGTISPGKWLGDQKDRDYAALRPHAHASYSYARLRQSALFHLPGEFRLLASLRMQGTYRSLLPSEQMGIGGHDTVRGYEERDFTADNGLIANLELKSPRFKLIMAKPKWDDALCVTLFFDYGAGRNCDTSPGVVQSRYLMSVGPGLRYTIGDHFSLRVDAGVRLHDRRSNSRIKTLPNFGMVLVF